MTLLMLFAFLSGGTRVLSRQANSLLSQKSSVFHSTLLNYITGLTLSVLVYCLLPKSGAVSYDNLPLWIFSGGLIGVVSVSLTSFLAFKLSQLSFSILLLCGQLLGSLVLDQLLGQLISSGRLIGVSMILIAALIQLNVKNQVA